MFIVTGTSFAGSDPLGEEDYLTIKYSPAGVQQWTARYNGPISEPDRATAIAVDKSGNSYVTGYSRGVGLDIATIKYNSNGTQQWVARYDGPAHSSDIAYAIALDNAGNVYVAGSDQAILYNTDFCTIKYNSSGVQQWEARYASATKDNDEAYAIAVDGSSNAYVTGYINGVSPSWDIATIKYNSSGAQQWVEKMMDRVTEMITEQLSAWMQEEMFMWQAPR
ncbi:MAG TPA: SBBP repeat-containing protein [Chitinophagaceae bacterium]|nr:SBBP repeat-containing protein [Chitinophagaceae bacterium]